jgi:type II secretory pathway pseudopilin PulG
MIIIIIALLLAGVIEGDSRILPKAKKTEAAGAAGTVRNALTQFQQDYKHLPHSPGAPASGDADTDSSSASGLMTVLKGLDERLNPRGNDYLGDIKDAKARKSGVYLNGIWHDGEKVALFDPWGYYYRIRLDSDGDGFVTDPRDATKKLPGPAVIWSIGKDGDPDTWDDNVIAPRD